MHDESMRKALDELFQQRIESMGILGNPALSEAYHELNRCGKVLKEQLLPKQRPAFLDLENAYSLVDGKTMNCYYRAGFSDAVNFLLGWREGAWN